MKTILSLTAVVVLLVSCSKEIIRGEGANATEQRSISNFTTVKAFGSNNVFITQGPGFNVEIKGYGNLLPYFETTVSGGVLELKYKNNVRVRNDNIEIYITMPQLAGLSLYGSGNIACTGNFTGNTSFEATVYGSGDITVQKGDAQRFKGIISGSGSIKAFGFFADDADITISGSGNQEISVNNTLNGHITGSGNIYFKGDPVVNSQITGSGSIVKK